MNAARWLMLGWVPATVATGWWALSAPSAEESLDPRTLVELDEQTQHAVLAEMRRRLEALQQVLAASGAGDVDARVAAAQDGLASTVDRVPAFATMDGSARRSWEVLAEPSSSAVAVEQALVELTATCVTCHDAMRFGY